jgi:hypothetical protein
MNNTSYIICRYIYIYPHSVFHIPSCNGSLVIAVKLKAKSQFFLGHNIVVLHFIKEITLTTVAHVLKINLLPYILSGHYIKWSNCCSHLMNLHVDNVLIIDCRKLGWPPMA